MFCDTLNVKDVLPPIQLANSIVHKPSYVPTFVQSMFLYAVNYDEQTCTDWFIKTNIEQSNPIENCTCFKIG